MRRLYSLLLNLFPGTYREEYGDEQQTVFNLLFDDAMNGGWFEAVGVVLRELAGLPKAILYQHLRERRKAKMIGKFTSRFDFEPGSFLEFVGALYPFFLLGGILPLMTVLFRSNILTPQSVLVNGIGILLVVITGILCLIGLAKGLPRWSLPYLGFLISLFSVLQFEMWFDLRRAIPFDALYARSWFLRQLVDQGTFWVGILVVMLILVLMIGFIPFLRRFKEDWTLLSLVAYGASPLALLFAFDEYEYVNDEPYKLLASLLLAAGLWVYLRTNEPRRRFWVLFGGLTASLFFVAVSKAILSSSVSWPYPQISLQNEVMSTIITWVWLVLGMLIPLALKLFSQTKDQLQKPDVAVM